jgi:hypothetical protein
MLSGKEEYKGNKIIEYLFTVPSKSTAYQIKGVGLDIDVAFPKGTDYTIPPNVTRALLSTFLNEYNRIKSSRDKNITNKAYKQGSSKFLFYTMFNKDQEIGKEIWNGENLKELDSVLASGETVEQFIVNNIKTNLKNIVQEQLLNWDKIGIIEKGKLEAVADSYKEKHKAKSDKQLATQAALEYTVNSMLSKVNMHQMFIGDPAVYYKDNINDTWENLSKRLAALIAPGIDLSLDNVNETFVSIKIADNKTRAYNYAQLTKRLDEASIKAYNRINSTDAQEYTTLREALHVEYRLGNVPTATYENILQRIEKDGDNLVLTSDELNMVFKPHKPVYSGSKINTEAGYVEKIYVKSSSIPLLPQFTKGLQLDKVRLGMEKIEKQLNKNSTSYIGVRAAYDSAVKVGGKDAANIWNGDSINDDVDFSPNYTVLNRKDFRIQQELPVHEELEVTRSTQVTKQLFDSILKEKGFNYKSKEYTGEELYAEYLKLHDAWFEAGKQKVTRDILTNGEIDEKKVAIKLLDELLQRNSNPAQIESVSLNKSNEMNMPIWANNSLSQIEPILTSIFTKNILKQPMFGKAYVLVSPAGFQGKSSDIVYVGKNNKKLIDKNIEELLNTVIPKSKETSEVTLTTTDPNTGEQDIDTSEAAKAVQDIRDQYNRLEEVLKCLMG